MPLYDGAREPHTTPEDAVVVVARFLERCLAWADEREIPERAARASQGTEAAAKLHAWLAYREFTEHALRELRDGTLDPWFTARDEP